jgi:hemoglobin
VQTSPETSVIGRVVQAELTEDAVAELVDSFYAKVRHDECLGPVFARVLGDDDAEWAAHLDTLRAFWSSVMLTSGRYKGDPFSVHRRLGGLDPAMFARWLALFHQTCAELFPPVVAAAFERKAERIARSLRMGLFETLPACRAQQDRLDKAGLVSLHAGTA